MIDNTINDNKTIAGIGKDVILAGRYHILIVYRLPFKQTI